MPLEESVVYHEKNMSAFFREILKYIFIGDGILTCPFVDIFIFAKASLLDDQGRLRTSPAQMNAKDPANIPDIEIMPVSVILSSYFNYFNSCALLVTL